jgi:pimeloyl-ACP methyl ester carboxylesterase
MVETQRIGWCARQEERMLAYERHGSGDPLVLVHGVTHRRQAWYPVLDELAAHREVILVDLPGHGDSPPFVLDGLSVRDALRRDFEGFLDELGLDRPHIAGNSLGGLVALHAGANNRASSVTCLSPAGFWRDEAEFAYTRRFFIGLLALADKLGPSAERAARSRAVRQVVYSTLMAHPSRVPFDHVLGDVRAFMYAQPTLRTLLGAAEPFTDAMPADIPVTVAWSGRDLVLPRWQADTAKQRLPQAEHVILRGVGHVPMFDHPRLVTKVLLEGSAPRATVASFEVPVKAQPRRVARAATA